MAKMWLTGAGSCHNLKAAENVTANGLVQLVEDLVAQTLPGSSGHSTTTSAQVTGPLRWRGLSMPTLVQLYEYHVEDCIRSAAKTNDPKQRDMLLKL